MSAPEHRHAGGRVVDRRLWLVAAFVLGVALTAAVAVALDRGSSGSSTQPSRASDRGGSAGPASTPARPSRSPAPSPPTSPPTSSPSPTQGGADVQHGLMTQPLAQLQPGDRVVYQMSACRFRSWVVRLDVALIACPGEAPFQVRTAYLVPVEPGGD